MRGLETIFVAGPDHGRSSSGKASLDLGQALASPILYVGIAILTNGSSAPQLVH
jgi:hypothetical protein